MGLGHIGVLMGGYSSEREISLRSGKAIAEALHVAGCQVSSIDITCQHPDEISEFIKGFSIDVAFIALHGCLGEDGTIQSILEKMKIPYTGSNVEASRKAINKVSTQKILKEKGVPVAEYIVANRNDKPAIDVLAKRIHSFPVVVKPACEGSSIGVVLVQNKEGLPPALEGAFKYGPEVIIERYIKGRELTVGILDETPLPVIEIKSKSSFFDFSAKYQSGTTEYIVPAQIPEALSQQLKDIALAAHQALGCRHLSRVDIMLDEKNSPFVLEINTIPGFTSTSLLPKAAKVAGLSFADLCLRLTQLAYEK